MFLAAAGPGDQAAWQDLADRCDGLLWSVARGFRLSTTDAADMVRLNLAEARREPRPHRRTLAPGCLAQQPGRSRCLPCGAVLPAGAIPWFRTGRPTTGRHYDHSATTQFGTPATALPLPAQPVQSVAAGDRELLAAGRMMPQRTGMNPADLMLGPNDPPRVPTFDEYVPTVQAAVRRNRAHVRIVLGNGSPPSGDRGLLDPSPTEVEQFREEARRQGSNRHALSAHQMSETNLCTGATGDDPELDMLILRLHTETACRTGDALALRPRDLNPDQCLVHPREQDCTARWQPVSACDGRGDGATTTLPR